MKYTIIGAGIGGLTTALAFEQKGIDYEIYEKAPQLNEVGAGIWLAPNALQVLESLGVLNEVQQKGNSIDRITLGKADVSPLSDNHQDNIKNIFGYSSIAIHRAELQKLLFDKIPSDKVHLGKVFSHLKQTENQTQVFFEDGSNCVTHYVIGADGINSKVRQQLFPKSKKRYTGQTCWRGVANIELQKAFKNRGIELWGNQVRFGISEVSPNKIYWFAVALDKANQKDNPKENLHQKLTQLFNGYNPVVHKIIRATPLEKIIRNDINDLQPLQKWYKNNCCLIGDAGHATTPNMGQGGAQAIEDAWALSNLVEEYPTENIFEKFQNKRQKKVEFIVKQSWNTGKMAHWKYGTWFRNLLLKNMPNSILEKSLIKLYQID